MNTSNLRSVFILFQSRAESNLLNFHKWTDRSHPQTLQFAVLLFYFNAVFALLETIGINLGSDVSYGVAFIFGIFRATGVINTLGTLAITSTLASAVLSSLVRVVFLVLALGHGFAGLSIANERKWGYYLGIGLAIIDLGGIFTAAIYGGVSQIFSLYGMLGLLWIVLLLGLLLHHESRQYKQIWFR